MSANGQQGQSYQRYDGASGTYQDNSTPNSSGPLKSRAAQIGALVGVFVIAFAIGYASTSLLTHDAESFTREVIQKKLGDDLKKESAAEIDSNGEIKLFDELNRFVMEDYDAKSTFSSFLPAVAGYFGKPVWAFYVNRGQGIATFGTKSKDFPILEFNAANKAYQNTPFLGFRTFIHGSRSDGTSFATEPFGAATARDLVDDEDDPTKPKRLLYVGTNEMEIEELDVIHGLTTRVKYFILPEEDFASLVRRTTFVNTGESSLTLDVLDGVARIEPFGGALDWALKNMGRTLEGWMGVYHADETLNMPFYKLSTEPADTAKVVIENSGHYCIAFIENDNEKAPLVPIVFDTSKVFGKDTSFAEPDGFEATTVHEILSNPQYGWAKTSSAFASLNQTTLAPGESITLTSVYGKADTVDLVPEYANVVTAPGFIGKKFERAREITKELTAGVETKTANPLFDGTVAQMFLDNGLRGGFPTILGNVDSDATYDEDPGVKVFHTFSRIHGDLERDYNAFDIEPTYFSQGPGNFRDIAQNRRNDVTFCPRMASFDIQEFLSFIQADAYEPLTVEAVVYRFPDQDKARSIAAEVTDDDKSAEVLGNVLVGGDFRPGQIFELCEQLRIKIASSISKADFINKILAGAEDRAMGTYGEGFWGDHWDYYMDLINAYLDLYPDQEEALMYDKELRYFFSTATVKPRREKYVQTLTYDGSSYHIQQLESTYWDDQKVKEQEAFRIANTGLLSIEANWQRTENGDTFMSNPISKLFLLGAIKFATRDSYGMGIEYEAGRPGWLDAMNGLPGMLGSGMPETYELKLLLQYIKKVVDKYGRDLVVPEELGEMVDTINDALKTLLSKKHGYTDADELSLDVPDLLFQYWDTVTSAREKYRDQTHIYFSGNTRTIAAGDASAMLGKWLDEIEKGIARSFQFGTSGYGDDGKSGIPPSYFAFEATDWKKNGLKNPQGLPLVDVLALKVRVLPLFLEGPVRYMKTIEDDVEKMTDMYNRVLSSGLRDTILNMYFLSGSLKGQTYDIGRQVSFAPGWLENQSIWMHMSYKYYLQLIRGRLHDQFYSEYENGGILPMMDADVYGRSLMECSSFIASSVFPDPSIVGEGFLPRLSGSTAEFMDMYKNMFIGKRLFFLNKDNEVEMQLTPAIPSWLFEDPKNQTKPTIDDEGRHTVMFKLFAAIPVTYHNPGGKNLYGNNPKGYNVTMKSGDVVSVDGPTVPTDTALKIRRVTTVESIDAYF